MSSVNKVILVGNIGSDPDCRELGAGREVVNFSLATGEKWKEKTTGERKEKTEWHRVCVFNEGLVKVAKSYLKKGSKIYIEGSLQTKKWTDQSGNEKYTTEVVLSGFGCVLVMLGGKQDSPYDGKHQQAKANGYLPNAEALDDEIPF